MPSRPTATIEAGTRGLAERVSRRPFGSCMFFAHRRQPTNNCRRVYCLESASAAAGTSACMTCMVRTVLTIHARYTQVHLSRLPLSATKASLAKLLLHRHPSDYRDHQCAITCVPPSTRYVCHLAKDTYRRE